MSGWYDIQENRGEWDRVPKPSYAILCACVEPEQLLLSNTAVLYCAQVSFRSHYSGPRIGYLHARWGKKERQAYTRLSKAGHGFHLN